MGLACRLTSFSDVRNVIILKVQDPLGVLDDGTGVGSDKELDGLGHAVVRHEGSRLRSSEFGAGSVLVAVGGGWDGQETAGVVFVTSG